MNREWHQKHKMPDGASENERLRWHLEHTAHCGCRPVPRGLLAKMSETDRRKMARAPAEPERLPLL
jgi:hypothetical protein